MEIKVNVETNAEEREDVELFEQERRKEEEFKNKLEEQIDSLISQNEKEKSKIEGRFERLILHLTLTKCESPSSVWNIRPYNDLFDEFEKRYQEEGW